MLAIFLFAVFSIPGASAASVTLAWDANTEPDLAGYFIYYGPINSTPQRIDVGLVTSTTINNLTPDITYVFYATAYNTAGLESDPSQKISYRISNDTDGDGIPDSYETANNLNPNNAGDANTDADGDGFSSLQEYWSGTNPNNSQSSLRILRIAEQTTAQQVQFPSVSGNSYSLEANDNFPGGSWQNIANGVGGTGGNLTVT
ncbi:MAG TPA: fibronectin type III domain-containing protein, partial [Verrucomicrobiae bacterium]|nr:fibronectin type III domain-containing protein [Verrucomicrobiae bacterium]